MTAPARAERIDPPWIERLSAGYDRAAVAAATVLLGCLVLLVATQVFYRYALAHPLTWSEELSTDLFAWIIFLGATIAVRRDLSPALRLLIERLPPLPSFVVEMLVEFLAFAVSLALTWNGVLSSRALLAQTSPSLQIPMGYPTVILPIAGAGLSLHYAARIAARIRSPRAAPALLAVAPAAALAVMFVALPHLLPAGAGNAVLLGTIVFGLAIGMPVALALIAAVMAVLLGGGGQPLAIVPQTLFTGASNVILMAVPFFMLTGAIMESGSLAQRLIDFSSSLVGRFRGGLLYVDVISSAIFADISGSAVSDTAAIGSVMLPGMVRRGYDPRMATALQAASGTLGVLFPPSIATIIYSWVANTSVAEMFLASFVPALLMVISFCVVAYITAARNNYPREPAASGREIAAAFRQAFWALLAPLIIVGSIVKGIVTPAEAGVIAVLYTFAISALHYRALTPATTVDTLVRGVIGTARVMFILSAAILLSWMLTILQIPQQLSGALLGLSHDPLVLLILLNVLLVIVHGVLETNSTIILIVPLVLPVFAALGVSPIHLGIIFLVNSALGLLTPPLGFLLYVAAPITGLRIEVLARAVVPFLVTILIDLSLVVAFPQISTFLPRLFGAR